MRRQDVLKLRPVDQSLVKGHLRAARVAEDILDAGSDQLLGKGFPTVTLEDLDRFRRDRFGVLTKWHWLARRPDMIPETIRGSTLSWMMTSARTFSWK